MLKQLSGGAAIATLLAGSAVAGPGGDAFRDALYAGELAKGVGTLTPLAAGSDQEAKFGLGALQFLQGFEGLVQALYRHGLSSPDAGPLGPVLGIPVPQNVLAEPLDYGKFRTILQNLVTAMDTARATLTQAGESGDYVIEVDLARVRFDINADGKADASESVGALFRTLAGVEAQPPEPLPNPTTPETGGVTSAPSEEGSGAAEQMLIGLDRADAIWLAGYSEVFAIQSDFFLAHDFTDFFNSIFHRFFPRARLPMQPYAQGGSLVMDPQTDTAIADAVAAIHTLNWPVVEPERLKGVLERAGAVTNFSRANWAAILLETDDNHELLPSPRQTGPSGEQVTQEQVDAWLKTLDDVDGVIAGELLLPHWRFRQGFDLKAYFETATRTDLVMLLTGMGALPYLKDGPIANAEVFAAANRAFGENLIGYAFWFN